MRTPERRAPTCRYRSLALLVGTLLASSLVDCTRLAKVELIVNAPDQTDRASVVIEGRTEPGAAVAVDGGILPVNPPVGADGAFRAEVALWPDTANHLIVHARTAPSPRRGERERDDHRRGGEAVKELDIAQHSTGATGWIAGRVVDAGTGQPVAGATVGYGRASATTALDGAYTLAGVPDGQVAVIAKAPGRLTNVTLGVVSAGRGRARDTRSQALAPAVTVGPEGGTWSGPGWRVDIPAGALATPTALNITPLAFTGDKDIAFGAPLVDLSPTGLRFAKPVAVTVDPTLFGLDTATTRVRTVGPDGLTATTTRATVVGHELRIELTSLAGVEIRMELSWDLGLWGGEAMRCQPFTSQVIAWMAHDFLGQYLLPTLAVSVGYTSVKFYGMYLTPGVASPDRIPVNEQKVLDEFRDSPESVNPIMGVFNDIRIAIKQQQPALSPPDAPTTGQISDLPSFSNPNAMIGQHVPLEWGGTGILSAPANLAGGIGGAQTPAGFSVADDRTMTGPYWLVPTADARGVRTHIELKADLTLEVLDSIDFCPGGSGNDLQHNFTLPMSRLEMTPHPAGGFWAKPVLFVAKVGGIRPADFINSDITNLYPTNDRDGDGIPDAQPWRGASFALDNCPDKPNPDQGDCDDDEGPGDPGGSGNAPAPPSTPAPDSGPQDPGAGGSYGDPHLVTFDDATFDLQAAGDYILVQSTVNDLMVQGRFSRRPGQTTVSFNRGVAIRFAGTTVAFGDVATIRRGDPLVIHVDGQPVTVAVGAERPLPGGGVLRLEEALASVRYPDGTVLEVGNRTGGNQFVRLGSARWGKVRGLLGNADRNPRNDVVIRDGAPVTDVFDLAQINRLGDSWRVEGAASLFRSVLQPEDVQPPNPTGPATVAGLSPAARAKAERICRERGLTVGNGLEQCILDVGITGDAGLVADAVAAARHVTGSVSLGALQAPVEDRATARLGQRIRGTLGRPFAADEYTVDLAAGSTVKLSAPACPGAGTFSVTLIAPDGHPMGRSAGAGCGAIGVTQLRAGGTYTVRAWDGGGFTGDYELQVDGADAGTSSQGAVDFCTVVKLEELASATSKTLVRSLPSSVGNDKLCRWEDSDGYSALNVDSFATTESFDRFKTLEGNVAITGVGEEAFLSGFSTVYVKAKGRAFMAQAAQPAPNNAVGAEVQAALKKGRPSGPQKPDSHYEAAYRLAKILVTKL